MQHLMMKNWTESRDKEAHARAQSDTEVERRRVTYNVWVLLWNALRITQALTTELRLLLARMNKSKCWVAAITSKSVYLKSGQYLDLT